MTTSRIWIPSLFASIVLTAALAVGSLLAVGCATTARIDSSPSGANGPAGTGPVVTGSPGSAPPPAAVDGRTFHSRSITENGAPHQLQTGTQITMTFRDGRLSADAGCNSTIVAYSTAGEQIRLGTGKTMTAVGCAAGGQIEQEQWFATLLSDQPTIVVNGDTLTVTRADTQVVLVEQ